ncbi:uncharacterized protein LOC120257366 [Dioscorea cayenensis subsp. rotundata]|uniref:Uncharacterized protein LOC120257366 n=1 Tax=Dioscorea cayennensis subsp. rotundata TaxID=55577 RepID=A0AB40B244_DIOCR|nr:uncharacterized protein LOC120257366 [Dioscorea cayenensis subsp. rotundata]
MDSSAAIFRVIITCCLSETIDEICGSSAQNVAGAVDIQTEHPEEWNETANNNNNTGTENVVHMVIDNAANYVAAGRLLEQEFATLYWSPCAVHCINLMLQDIGKLDEHTNGKEILHPAPTRFATNFIALQSILSQKDAIQAMVTSKEWTTLAYAKERAKKKFVDHVLDSSFWKECVVIVKVTEPLVRVLRIVDGDDRLAMGFIYEAINKAREEMRKRFQSRKKRVEPHLKIVDSRWDRQLHKNLHAVGYWLNPRFQYNNQEMENHKHTISGLLDVIERYSNENLDLRSMLTSEMKFFRKAQGDFGRRNHLKGRNFDPLNFEDFDEIGDWVLEEEPNILSSSELKDFSQHLASCDINIQDNDDLNMDAIFNDDDDDDDDDDESHETNGIEANLGTNSISPFPWPPMD